MWESQAGNRLVLETLDSGCSHFYNQHCIGILSFLRASMASPFSTTAWTLSIA